MIKKKYSDIKMTKMTDKKQIEEQIMMAMQAGNQVNLIDILSQIETPYLCYDCREDMKNSPKAFEVLREFLVSNSNGAIDTLEDDQLEMAIFMNPRMLYDFFDSKGINLGINDTNKESWGYTFEGVTYYNNYTSRHEAEKAAFAHGFTVLEKQVGA